MSAQLVEARFDGPQPWPFRDRDHRLRVQTVVQGVSRTKSEYLVQTDINVIMKNYKKTGLVSHLAQGGRYEELPDQSDYHAAMNLTARAQEAFAALPAELRNRFANEPGRLLGFLNDPQNREEAERLGLVNKLIPPAAPPEPPQAKKPPKAATLPDDE